MLTSEPDPHVQTPEVQPCGVGAALGPNCAVPVPSPVAGQTDFCLETLW